MTSLHRHLAAMAATLWLVSAFSVRSETNAAPRTAPDRPKIGLALGGGGALGLAHIGVLKELEARRIPVDYIAGTSMGSIIAGLYASGMAPEEIQGFLGSLDWNEVLNDATPRRELFFRRKRDDQRYLFELGLNRNGPMTAAGMAAGQKLDNVLQYMVLRAAAVTNFDLLPIPFRAVATDLQTGLPHVMNGGNLATAMRASMAVPGVFTPVERDGRLLADGGVVDNLPVDVVKAMGADIVIAVDVGADSDTVDPETLKTLGGILGRSYAIAQRPKQVLMYRKADIGIQPVLAGFTASQFDRVEAFVPKGLEAARKKGEALDRLALTPAEYEAFLARQRRPPPGPARVESIAVAGAGRVSEASIRGRIHSREGEPFDPQRVNRDLMRVYGIGEFEHVLFRLEPREDGTAELVYDVREKSWGPLYFRYGLNLQSDLEGAADWSMLLNFTRMSINPLGAEWRNDFEIGSTRRLLSEFYQPVDTRGFLFLAPNVTYDKQRQAVYQEKEHIADYDRETLEARADFGIQLRQYAELRIGPLWGSGKSEREVGAADLPEFDERYSGLSVSLIVDVQDRTLFAREGHYFQASLLSCDKQWGGESDFDKAYGILRGRHSFGNHTLIGGVQAGSSLGSDLPVYSQFTLGGAFGFAGLARDQFRGSYLGIGSLGYSYRLKELPSQIGRGIYALIRFDTGNVWEEEFDLDDRRNGVALGLGADTAIGPLFIGYGLAEQGYDQWYFSLGTAF